jgi:hypothetical protein
MTDTAGNIGILETTSPTTEPLDIESEFVVPPAELSHPLDQVALMHVDEVVIVNANIGGMNTRGTTERLTTSVLTSDSSEAMLNPRLVC